MKLKRKLLAGLLTLCMAVGMAVPAFAANGPSFGDYSSAYLRLGNSEDGYQTLFANSGQIDDVSGAVYDKASNTVTLTNYNNPTNILVANEMGDDLKLKLVGDNHISSLVVYGFGWGGNLEIIGDGSLTINENKTSSAAIAFMAEGTQGSLKVGSEATVTAYKMPDAPHMATYSAKFISTTSKSIPFTGNFETKLALTADSGVELEYEQTETVITEAPYESRTWQVATKGNDGRLYGVYFFEADETIGSQGQTDIAELVKVNDLPSGNEYLALEVKIIQGSTEWPAEYTKDADGKTIEAKIDMPRTMKVLKKGEETFYWGTGNIKYDEEGEGTPYYTLYKAIGKVELPSDARYEANVVTPVDGMEDITADQEGYPEGYKTVIEKTGMYSYYCTNDVIKVSPSGTSTDPGTDPGTKPGEDTGAKDLTASETGVSISLTDGVPEGAELFADTIAQESVLGSRPELKEELPGLLSIYDISVRKDGKALEIKDNPMTVKIPMNDHLKGHKYYQAVYLGDPLERFDAVVEGDFLVFETTHLSQYAILGSNTPFETSEQPTDPTTPTDPTDPANPEQPGKPSEQTESPQTGDSSNMFLLVALLFASGGVLTVLGVTDKRKKKGITK
ncbi:sortase B protein-sorting domain-containing protein [[Ruminococcus] torques]|uniref:sortase B protein-sorting domain-containing protein n=1 Tax=[Ruminococcus] torques TaxID=33039 RepID=UPI0025A37D54|nr:sortase B protein-sorting domain-containing protein [[Ruminococcus] torques]MDM8237377.1 sortase B protein-sorting domain-containing protein [[Ruminococcus] torques]